MATATLPPPLFTIPEAKEQLTDGLANATAALGAFWPALDGMGEQDMRWDDLCRRAIEAILPQIGALLDAAIAAEWQRWPVEL